MRTFRILGMLLNYPTQELVENLTSLSSVLHDEGVLKAKTLKGVDALINMMSKADLMDLQEDYVGLFDRSRAHSLYLFEHIHGESRDRGMAMINLRGHYAEHGLTLNNQELPDYLPMFLEFLSILDFKEAQSLLNETVHIYGAVGGKLAKKGSLYASLFKALEALATVKADPKFVEAALNEKIDDSLEALDEDWVEPEAFNGLGEADCGSCSENIRRMGENLEAEHAEHEVKH